MPWATLKLEGNLGVNNFGAVSIYLLEPHCMCSLFMPSPFIFSLFFFKFIHLFWRKERMLKEERESQTGSVPSAWSTMRGSNPWTVRLWPEPKSRVGGLTDWSQPGPLRSLNVNIYHACFIISLSLFQVTENCMSSMYFLSLFFFFKQALCSMWVTNSWPGDQESHALDWASQVPLNVFYL